MNYSKQMDAEIGAVTFHCFTVFLAYPVGLFVPCLWKQYPIRRSKDEMRTTESNNQESLADSIQGC